ncbi:hypothetical protein [Nonomuraea jabiensis]|uniref:hypothetical protein n=1 Tax=Nonomuraea jabiensis TaxID=882448 RepID=UPI003D73B98E
MPEIEWLPSPRSLTCMKGWVGSRILFSLIATHSTLTLNSRLPGRDGTPVKSETFDFKDPNTELQARAQAHERATAMLAEFLNDLVTPRQE